MASSPQCADVDDRRTSQINTQVAVHRVTELGSQLLSSLKEHNDAVDQLLQHQNRVMCCKIEQICSSLVRDIDESPSYRRLPSETAEENPVPLAAGFAMPGVEAEEEHPHCAGEAEADTPAVDCPLWGDCVVVPKDGTPTRDQTPQAAGEGGLESMRARRWWNVQMDSGQKRLATSKFMQVLMHNTEEKLVSGSLRARLNSVVQVRFDLFIGSLIILNTFVMFVQLEVEAPSPTGTGIPDPGFVFELLTQVFNGIFVIELILRIYVKRLAFFMHVLNWIDCAIVMVTSFDVYILQQVNSKRQNISFMRLLRFVRVVRAFRVIRTMNLFRQLRVLLNTVAMSFMSLFWSMLILFIFMLMFSLFLCQILQSYIANPENEPAMREWTYRYYGTSTRSLYTVFEITFSGGWPTYARPIVEQVETFYALFFSVYITGVVFAMVRIISALFLKDTLQTAANDADMMVQERTKEMRMFVGKLTELFEQADSSQDGYLNKEELDTIMSYPKVKLWMGVLGLDVSETTHLFQMLDDGDGLVSYDEFVNGILRLKGTSRSQDTIAIMKDCKRMCKICEATQKSCEAIKTDVLLLIEREVVSNRSSLVSRSGSPGGRGRSTKVIAPSVSL